MARKDVELVIRARDQAKKVVNSLSDAFDDFTKSAQSLQGEAGKTDTQLGRLGEALGGLQRNLSGLNVASKLGQDLDRARGAIERLETSTKAAAGEAIGYQREARKSAAATAELRVEAERVGVALNEQKAAVASARSAQTNLTKATAAGAKAQERSVIQQAKLGEQIDRQRLNLANYAARYKELQIAITSTVQPTARVSREFSRTATNIQKTEARIETLTAKQAEAVRAQVDAERAVRAANVAYSDQANDLQRAEASVESLSRKQRELGIAVNATAGNQRTLEQAADRAGTALERQDAALAGARNDFEDYGRAVEEADRGLKELEATTRGQFIRSLRTQFSRLRETEEAFAANSAEAQRLARELRETEAPTRELQQAFEAYRAAAARGREEIRNQQVTLQQLRAVIRETGGDVDSFAARQQRFAAALDRGGQSFREYATTSERAVAANRRLTASQATAQTRTDRLTNSTRALSAAQAGAGRNTGLFADAIRRSYGETRTALSFTQRLRGEVLSLLAAYGGFFAAVEGVRAVVNSYKALEQAQIRLQSVFDGNELAVTSELGFLRRNAERLGVEFGTLANEYTKFAVATQGTNLEGANTRKIFQSVSEAARVNGASLDQLQGTFVALTQIVSKGTLSMEEIRQQLGDRIPGAARIFADSLGLTTAEFFKLVENGELSSDTLIQFAEELDRRFGGQLQQSLSSTAAVVGRFQNSIFQALVTIGQGGAIEGFTDLVNRLGEAFDAPQAQDFFARIGAGLQSLFGILGSVVDNWDLLIVAITSLIGLKVAPFIVALVASLARLPAVLRLISIRSAGARAGIAALGTSFGTATGAAVGFRAALTGLLSSTGIGLLVTLIGTAIGLWVTRTESATEALATHRDLVDRVKNAYDRVSGSVGDVRDAVKDITTTQARASLAQLRGELRSLEGDFEGIGGLLRRNIFGQLALGSDSGVREFLGEIENLFLAYKDGNVTAKEFQSGVDALVESYRDANPEVAKLGSQILETTGQMIKFEDAIADVEKILVAKTGTAEEAEEALDALNGVVKDTEKDAKDAATRLAEYQSAIQNLSEQVPSLTDGLKALKDEADLTDAYRSALQLAEGYSEILKVFDLYQQGLTDLRRNEIDNFTGGTLVDRIIGSESNNVADARNPNSSATGVGQFVEKTWLELFRKHLPERAESLSESAILALRTDRNLSRQFVDIYVKELAQQLQAGGLPVTDANVYLSYFLGGGGASSLLNSEPGTTANELFPQETIDANQSVLDGKTREEIIAWARERVGVSKEQLAVRERLGELDREQAEDARKEAEKAAEDRQDAMKATTERLEQQDFEIAQQTLKNLGKDREAAIEQAIREAKAENANISQRELDLITQKQGKLFDLANAEKAAQAQRDLAEKGEQRVNDLLTLRSNLQQELAAVLDTGGDAARIEGIETGIKGVNEQLQVAIANAIQLFEALAQSDPAVAATVSRLRTLEATGTQTASKFVISFKQVEGVLANNLTNAAVGFAESLAAGRSVTQSLRDAFLQFASDFLRQIAQMIIQQIALNAVKAIGRALGGGVFHAGGVVGQQTAARTLDASVFAGAVRYHTGGIAGLQPGEVPAVLQRNEEVLTESDPRHVFNLSKSGSGTGGGQQAMTPKIINAIDSASFIEEAMKDRRGEAAILNFIKANRGAVNASLGKG